MHRLGIKAARKSPHVFQHGAIVTRAGAVLAVGYNHDFIHAEVAALDKLWPSKRQGTVVWSIRLTASGRQIANAKPCAKCLAYMREAGVRKVYYSTANRTIESLKL